MNLKKSKEKVMKSSIFNKMIVSVFIMVTAFVMSTSAFGAEEKEAIILYTNDVHCAIEGYSKLAAYKAQLEESGNDVVVVDAGDAIQGEAIGTQTQGKAIIDLMNEVGYKYAVPGNHEFDYGMDTFLELASSENSKFEYLSSTFVDMRTNETVFKPYDITEINGMKVAFVGISTPESYTKSTPVYFQDENGNDIYNFSQNDFYGAIQKAVDAARAEGADKVIAVGHLGVSGTTDSWKSTDVIANTTGIDVFIDAHSHEVIEATTVDNKNGEKVPLSSTGTKFQYIGQLELKSDGEEVINLISPDTIDINSSDAVKTAYSRVKKKVDDYNAQIQYLYEKIGTAEVELTLNDPDSGEWVIRTQETNVGDFVSDAYRIMTGADISLANAGGIRASVDKGDVTRKTFIDINPWNNPMCVVSATGQDILDALEFGARNLPETCGGFLHTSGLTYEIHTYIDSPVVLDEQGSFKEIDKSKQRRVANVKINGEAIDPEKKYTVASTFYLLKQGGDGFTMFADSDVVKQEGLSTDSDMLIQYFTEKLNSVISTEKYGNLRGEGRIVIYKNKADVPVKSEDGKGELKENKEDTAKTEDMAKTEDSVKKENKNLKTNESKVSEAKAPDTKDADNVALWILIAAVSVSIAGYSLKSSGHLN